jgi:hypothetical protein
VEVAVRTIKEIFRSHAVLNAEGKHANGTDKESNHAYGDAYKQIITSLLKCGGTDPRLAVKLMMEVGVADGSSLLAWREVFPNALCVGMDIHHSDKSSGERLEFHLGDMRKREDCERAAAGRQFDFIVEDATHQLPDTLATLLYLWPFLRMGGLYVVEEFQDSASLRRSIIELWPFAHVVDVPSPFGGKEQLVVFEKVWKIHADS